MDCIGCVYWLKEEDSYDEEYDSDWLCVCDNPESPFYETKTGESNSCDFFETID